MSQHGGQTHATCWAQQCCDMLRWHVAIVWPGPGAHLLPGLKDDVQPVLRSLSPQCLWASHDGMQIRVDLIRYEPLTLSLRRILNSFSNSFLDYFHSYGGFSSSGIRKNKAESFALIMAVDMKLETKWHETKKSSKKNETLNLFHGSRCKMLHFVTSYMKRN